MIAASIWVSRTLAPGERYPAFTSLGCYPLFYIVETHGHPEAWCVDCCNGEEDTDARVSAGGPNWEDSSLECDHCGARIESAYAEVEDAGT
jgi:hypothetical protein